MRGPKRIYSANIRFARAHQLAFKRMGCYRAALVMPGIALFIRCYAKQSKDDELMMATRIRDRAIRRAGELLKQIEPATGKNNQYAQVKSGGCGIFQSRQEAARQAGMSERQQVTAIRVANVQQADFERQVESQNPPTITKLAEQGTRPAPRPVVDLKGRDPGEFKRALHFVAEFEDYQRAIEKIDIDGILTGLIDAERAPAKAHNLEFGLFEN